jgi:hypothetical protein
MDKVNWDDYSPVGGDASAASTAVPAVDWSQFEPVKPTSFGRKLADIGTSFASGALGSTKAITDAAGAGNVVSNKLDGLQNSVADAFSPARRAERAARQQTIKTAEQSGSVLNEVGAHLGGFAEAPVSAMAEAAGSVVPVVASMFTPAGRSAAGRALLGAGLGAAQGAGSVKGAIYDAVQQRQTDSGVAPEGAQAAAGAAQAYTGPNAGSIAVGTGLGILAARSGIENTVSRVLGGHAAAGGASAARRAVIGAVAEGLPEAAQGGQERLASNLALQKEGFDVPTWQGVAGQATAEGLAGGALGAGVNAVSRGHPRTDSATAPAAMDPMDDPSVGAEPASPIGAAAVEPTAAPAIDPTAGPVSKAAAMAGDLGLAPDPAPADPNASILSPSGAQAEMDIVARVENLPIDARREGRFALKSLQSKDLPPGVRAFHEEQLRSLVGDSPAAVDPIEQQPVGGIERTRDARASATNPLDLALEPVDPVAYDGGIDFPVPPAQPAPATRGFTADEALINDLGLQRPEERQLAAAMRLPEANRLRVQAAEQGIGLSVVPHESGRGYAVVPSAELAPGQRNQTGGMLPLDRSLSGRMVAGADGVRQEGRAEAISIRNTEQVQRDQVQAERQRRTDLGLSNITPVRPVSPNTAAADLAGEKLKRGWTAFSKESQTLNVPRAEMPQIKAEHRGALVNFLNARGIDSAQGEVPAGNLKPTQAEFSPAKVEKAKSFVGGERSILVSSDGYVVDGHHQWLAKMAVDAPVKVIVLNAPIADLLPTVRQFPSATASGGSEPAVRGSTAAETTAQDVARRRELLASLDRGGIGTRTQKVEARLLDARDRLARQQAYPNVNKQEQQAAVAGLRLELADLEAVVGSKRGPGEGDLGGHTRSGLLAGAGQELDVEAPGGQVSGDDAKEPLNQALEQTLPASEAINSVAKKIPSRNVVDTSLSATASSGSAAAPLQATPRKAHAAAASTKIEDFGEKLAGARKDYAALLTEATTEDVAAVPLSKSWPEPDYQKLLDAGSDKWTVAFLHAARDAVPTKPQTSWKLQRWVSQVETVRNMAEKLLTGAWKRDAVESFVAAGTMRSLDGNITLYLELGHAQSLKGFSLTEHSYSLYKGQQYSPPKAMWTIEQKAKATAFGNWPRELATGDTRAQAIAAFKAKIDSTDMGPKPKGQTQFEIYRRRAAGGDYIIGKKIGREHVDLKQLPDLAAARKFMAENAAELEAALAKYKETPLERRPDNQPRVGDDHRNGAPVSPEAFASTFGFRGVQFGNYVEQGRRQSDLNETYDALMDLAAVLGVPARSLSLNGRLGLAFGARGKGGKDAPAAHYELDTVVINLTKGGGPGSLAHEWWHSLDNYFAKDGGSTGFATDGARIDKLRADMQAAFNAVRQATQLKSLRERSRELDKRKSKPYWNTPLELSARSFETYVIAKLQDQGAANDYLANVVGQEAWDVMEEARAAFFGESGTPSYPYPTTAELPAVRAGFDGFFRAVQTREDGAGNVALFSSGSPPPERQLSKERIQAVVDAALASIHSAPRVEVFSDPAAAGLNVPPEVVVSGATLPDGRIQVFQSGIGSELDVQRVLFHELFHKGVRNVLSPADYVKSMLDLAARDKRVQEYANDWKRSNAGPAQKQRLAEMGLVGRDLSARHEALAVEEGLARMAEELRAEKSSGTKPKSMRVRVLANWLAGMAEKMGMQRLAKAIRAMTYTDAEKFVLDAIDRSGQADPAFTNDVPKFRSDDASPSDRVGAALKGVTITNLKKQAGFKATDYMGLGLQFLGRRQLVDVYGKLLPQLRRYSDLMAQMDADKNEAGAGADQLAEAWGKLPDERALAELMHDATLAQMDPAKALVDGDNAVQHAALRRRFEALTPAAQAIYTKARDQYGTHMKEVRNAIKERIERSELRGPRKAELLKQMDDEFYGRIKGVYFPLARFGQYVVVVKDAAGKVVNVSRAETMAEADATRQQLLTPFPASQGFTVGKVLKAKDFVADRDAVGRGFMEQLYGALDKQDMNGKQRAELEDALGQLYLSALPDLSWAKHGIHRKGTPGYSQDARRAFAQNVFHGARYLAKLRYSDLLQEELTAMDKHVALHNGDAAYPSVRAQQVVDEMNKRHDAAMNPNSNPLSTALTSFGFMFHLGLSPASALVNLTQTALVAYPVMAAKWGYAKSAAALLEASKQTAKNGKRHQCLLVARGKAGFRRGRAIWRD